MSVLIAFMTRRARFKFAMRARVLKVRPCTVAFALTVVIATLLHRSGNVELNPGPGDHATPNRETDQCQEENSDNHPEKNKQGEEILSAIRNLADQMRKEMRFMAEKMSTELQSLKSDILTKCSVLEERCDALAQKYTSLEDRVFNNEACLGEVEIT